MFTISRGRTEAAAVRGKIEPAVRIVVNDVVLQEATVAHGLKDGDRVAFVPIVGGGLT